VLSCRTRGTVTQHPVRFQICRLELCKRFRLGTRASSIEAQILLVEQPENDFFAEERRDGRKRGNRLFFFLSLRILDHDAPSCGSRFSLISSLAMDLDAAVMASFNFIGGPLRSGARRLCGSGRDNSSL